MTSQKPPLLSGREIVKVFQRIGYRIVSQRGSHIKIRNDKKEITLIIPDHREVDRWTLKGILRDAEISVSEFISILKGKK
jgi:predicted RNA binding protein YcfA (HicA-like mRNA interferase family)